MGDPEDIFVLFCLLWEDALRNPEREILSLHPWDVWRWQMKWNCHHATPDLRLDLEAEWPFSSCALLIFSSIIKGHQGRGLIGSNELIWFGYIDTYSLLSWQKLGPALTLIKKHLMRAEIPKQLQAWLG